MDITGKIIQFLPEQTGQGKKGQWKRQDFVIETQDQYPKKICISTWGDKVSLRDFSENEVVKVYFNLESREYNGRWYSDIRAWKIEKGSGGESGTPSGQDHPPFIPDAGPSDDLPF